MNFTWDPAAGRYRDSRGRFVSFAALKEALIVAIDNAQRRMQALAEQYRRGELNPQEWELRMAEEVRTVNLYAAAVARGGWAQLTESDLVSVEAFIRQQLQYLHRFARQLEWGMPLNGNFTARVAMYANAAHTMYERLQRYVQFDAGRTEERNILQPKDHCEGCIEAASLGWVPIFTLPPVGTRSCLTNCKCVIEYR